MLVLKHYVVPWIWRQHVPVGRWYLPVCSHDVATLKNNIDSFPPVFVLIFLFPTSDVSTATIAKLRHVSVACHNRYGSLVHVVELPATNKKASRGLYGFVYCLHESSHVISACKWLTFYNPCSSLLLSVGFVAESLSVRPSVRPSVAFNALHEMLTRLFFVDGARLLFFPQIMIYEYGVLVKWYWQGKAKNSVKNLSQCHFVNHKTHMDWPVANPGLRGEGRRLTVWAMAQPMLTSYSSLKCKIIFHRIGQHLLPSNMYVCKHGWT
jgi:hypothetical protein